MNEWEWQLLEAKKPADDLRISGIEVRTGSRVKLHPRAGGDVMDIALAGKTAVIESIEQDYEGNFHLCVVVDDDPGRDIGLMRQPGPSFLLHCGRSRTAWRRQRNQPIWEATNSRRRNRKHFSRR